MHYKCIALPIELYQHDTLTPRTTQVSVSNYARELERSIRSKHHATSSFSRSTIYHCVAPNHKRYTWQVHLTCRNTTTWHLSRPPWLLLSKTVCPVGRWRLRLISWFLTYRLCHIGVLTSCLWQPSFSTRESLSVVNRGHSAKASVLYSRASGVHGDSSQKSKYGAAERAWTSNIRFTKPLLYPLSYSSMMKP